MDWTPLFHIQNIFYYLFSKENSYFVETFKRKDLAIDLGTGGGIPGLVLATFTDCCWLLVDRSKRRCAFLKRAVFELDLNQRVNVVEERVTLLGSGVRVVAKTAWLTAS